MANINHFSNPDPVWESHRPYVEALTRMTNSLIFVVVREEGYPFLSPNLELLGYKIPESGSDADDGFLKNRIHPDDREIFNDILTRLFHYVTALPCEERRDYKYIFEMRLLDKNDEWVRIICQLQILDFSLNGNPIELGTLDISPDQTSDVGLRFTLMNFKTGEIVPFTVHAENGADLTPREKEILKLIDKGMYSKAISEKLYISIHTVNRHRQNILEKTNANNIQEAINYARKFGLLA
jgi:DNA-binding CsgD family transcriptional regulator